MYIRTFVCTYARTYKQNFTSNIKQQALPTLPAGPLISNVEVKYTGSVGWAGFTRWVVVKKVIKTRWCFDIAVSRSEIKLLFFE